MWQSGRLLVGVLWVGALWAIGFMVAPTLFSTLADRSLAGSIAGSLFRIVAWLSVGCAIAIWILQAGAERRLHLPTSKAVRYLILAMLACTVLGYFCLQPFMGSLREILASTQDAVQLAEAKQRFGMLHGISTVFYVIQSLLGAALILKLR
ncbi:DUF4149 domain-containing protein [uncultured Oxalicibacterium sp.]|uniref:DUF4149 domain-containing protein n=1 Tax=uncultured Oxalicibacterium sp. TaxID=1168540 RepID=UPI0026011D5E|nr:DUF4149 domain-containing protein [uncultured Oxalicibacterium sp.]